MNCSQASQLIQAFGDGELDGEAQSLLRDHLRTCQRCRHAYDQRRHLVQQLAEALALEASAPRGLRQSVWRRIESRPTSAQRTVRRMRFLAGRRPARIAFSVAGIIGIVFALTWMLFGRDLALAKAIDEAMRQVKSAHFTAVEGERTIEVWATPEAERVSSDEGWMIAKDGKAYLFDARRKRVTITKGPLAQLQLLRGLNVLLLSARVRGQVAGEPTVAKETVTLPDGRRAIKITASGKARVLGATREFSGTMLVDPATNLIMAGEVTERTPRSAAGERVSRRSEAATETTHVSVDRVSYNVPVPAGIFDTTTPKGWTAVSGHPLVKPSAASRGRQQRNRQRG
ncbi:MAG: anti-sigma factor [Armatimonadota bacterium]